jgi:hypothetical protein
VELAVLVWQELIGFPDFSFEQKLFQIFPIDGNQKNETLIENQRGLGSDSQRFILFVTYKYAQ